MLTRRPAPDDDIDTLQIYGCARGFHRSVNLKEEFMMVVPTDPHLQRIKPTVDLRLSFESLTRLC